MRPFKSFLAFLGCTFSAVWLTGCVRDRIHQPAPHDPPALVDFTPVITPHYPKKPYIVPHPQEAANHATVEFKNHGRFFCSPTSKPPCQLDYAVSFIRQARIQAGAAHLVVLTFVHGNENNATESSDNYPHFEQLVSCLNLGETQYQNQKHYGALIAANAATGHDDRYVTCKGVPAPDGIKYAGIYIGWQGQLFKGVVNLQQNAAMRIGKRPAIDNALFALRNAAKDEYTPPGGKPLKDPARFVVIGHSFGGLLLEQAAIKIFQNAYVRNDPTSSNFRNCDASVGPKRGLKPFTDLMVTVNEAVNSLPALRLMFYFQGKGNVFCHGNSLAPSLPLPLLVTLHSKSDFFTGATGTVLRYIVPPRGGFLPSNAWETKQFFFHPYDWILYTHSTPANLVGFQNLCYIDPNAFDQGTGYRTGDRGGDCDSISRVTDPDPIINGQSNAPRHDFAKAFPLAGEESAAGHLHVRFDCDDNPLSVCAANDLSQSASNNLGTDFNSPYWAMSIDDAVIHGHNDLWSSKIIELVLDMSKAWASKPTEWSPLTREQVLN